MTFYSSASERAYAQKFRISGLSRALASSSLAGLSLASASLAVIVLTAGQADAQDTTSQESSGQAVALQTINVNGQSPSEIGGGKPEGHDDYLISHTTTGSKANLPNSYVPQHVTTVPQRIIEEQDVRSVSEALENVAGTSNAYPGYYPLDQITSTYIRGFQNSMTLRDGLWDPTPFGNLWIGNIDRVEVLKGPSALLYGVYSGGIGGIINLVSKKPFDVPRTTISTEISSENTHAVSADISTPLAGTENWAVRLNLLEGVYGLFPDHSSYEKRNYSGILQGQITPQDTLSLSYE